MSKKRNTRNRHARLIGWSLAWLVLLALVLPLIPYALAAYKDAVPGAVPDPGATLWEDVRQRNTPVSGQTQVGGVDAAALTQDASKIKKALERIVPPLLDSGHYLPCLDDRPRSNMPFSNYRLYRRILEEISRKG